MAQEAGLTVARVFPRPNHAPATAEVGGAPGYTYLKRSAHTPSTALDLYQVVL